MDRNQAEALRKELDQLLRKQSEVWNHEPLAQQLIPTFSSMRSDKRSFTKCAINSPIRRWQRRGSGSLNPIPLTSPGSLNEQKVKNGVTSYFECCAALFDLDRTGSRPRLLTSEVVTDRDNGNLSADHALPETIRRSMELYSVAAAAAGVSILALAQPAEAEMIVAKEEPSNHPRVSRIA